MRSFDPKRKKVEPTEKTWKKRSQLPNASGWIERNHKDWIPELTERNMPIGNKNAGKHQ